MKKLFLDNVRTVDMIYPKAQKEEFDVVRSYYEFVDYIQQNGLSDFISFDNDLELGEDGNLVLDGLAVAKWLVYELGMDLMKLNYCVHSANPMAAEQIRGLLENYLRYLNF